MSDEITLVSDKILQEKYQCSIEGTVISCIKHLQRYGEQTLPKEIWRKILFYAMKGMNCENEHLDATQRHALYRFLKSKETEWSSDPYISEFMKETRGKSNDIL